MKRPIIHYDAHSDTLLIATRRGAEEAFVEVTPGVNVELGAKGQVLGIEILKASERFPIRNLHHLQFVTS